MGVSEFLRCNCYSKFGVGKYMVGRRYVRGMCSFLLGGYSTSRSPHTLFPPPPHHSHDPTLLYPLSVGIAAREYTRGEEQWEKRFKRVPISAWELGQLLNFQRHSSCVDRLNPYSRAELRGQHREGLLHTRCLSNPDRPPRSRRAVTSIRVR